MVVVVVVVAIVVDGRSDKFEVQTKTNMRRT